jgi:nucleoid-associated protein YgaU
MRRDSRLGMAIGGVLVAVLIAYAVVVPKSNKKKVVLDTNGQQTAGQQTASAGESSVGGGALSATNTDAGSSTSGGSAQPPAAPSGEKSSPTSPADKDSESHDPPANGTSANWAALLAADHVNVPVIRTRTPDLANDTNGATGNISRGAGDSNNDSAPSAGRPKTSALPATSHRVTEGETFTSIAQSYYGDGRYATRIAKANPNIDPRRIRPGMTIHLPEKGDSASAESTNAAGKSPRTSQGLVKVVADSSREYAVQSGDSLYKISMKLYGRGDKADSLYELNKSTIGDDSARLKVGMILKLPQSPSVAAATH